MNKKANSAIFIIIATIVNMILILAFALLGFMLCGKLFPDGSVSEDSLALPLAIFGLCFLLPMVLGWGAYTLILRFLNKKFNLEDKMAPLFARRRGRRNGPGKDAGDSGRGGNNGSGPVTPGVKG
ncbi:MAG: hypothetical protein J5785_05950 [Spirochaetales bacterium]|nr:hypothetical protein [Spirochaetales bacterium]